MKQILLIIIVISAVIISSCRKGCTDYIAINYDSKAKKDNGSCVYDNLKNYDAWLYAEYRNPINSDPSLQANLSISSNEINIEQEPELINLSNGRIDLRYKAVTFKLNKFVYTIEDIVTERKNSDNWIIDDENKLRYSFSKSLDIILVLDVSSSLAGNIDIVKINSKEFVSNILGMNDEARIGILKFSRGSVFQNFTSSINDLHSFIDDNSLFNDAVIGQYELEGRSETALYESISLAIEQLNSSDAQGKGILTFTDGVNNFQFDPIHFTNENIIQKLDESNISSNTIGFAGNQGTVDEKSLTDIAINGDFSFPETNEELSKVFVRFSNSVAAVYDLIYNTNNAQFDGIQDYRFLFKTKLISE